MAKKSRIAHLNDDMLRSMTTKQIADQFYDGNNGAAWNALYGPTGRLNGEKPAKADGAAKAPRSNGGKRKGCLPARLDQSVNKALTGIIDSDDPAYIESPTWEQFKQARDSQGANWVDFISKKVKEKELEQFELWISSNDSADKAEKSAASDLRKRLFEAEELIAANGGRVLWD